MSDTPTLDIAETDIPPLDGPVERRQVDYFGAAAQYDVVLPDGESILVCEKMTDGARRKYLAAINRDVRIEKKTGNAAMRGLAGEDKVALIKTVVRSWNLVRADKNGVLAPVPFSDRELSRLLDAASPQVVDHIAKEINKVEPWLAGEPTIEEIDEEIESLQDLKRQLLEKEEGKASS